METTSMKSGITLETVLRGNNRDIGIQEKCERGVAIIWYMRKRIRSKILDRKDSPSNSYKGKDRDYEEVC